MQQPQARRGTRGLALRKCKICEAACEFGHTTGAELPATATGEALAMGSLMLEGHDVRLSGQDCQRGTFSHRVRIHVTTHYS